MIGNAKSRIQGNLNSDRNSAAADLLACPCDVDSDVETEFDHCSKATRLIDEKAVL